MLRIYNLLFSLLNQVDVDAEMVTKAENWF